MIWKCAFVASLLVGESSQAQSQFSYTTNADGDGVTITGLAEGDGFSPLSIPGSIDGLPVTAIGDSAFYLSYLPSITIGSNVTIIGSNSFFFCEYLTNVSIPDSVTEIDAQAFADCFDLRIVTGCANVTSLGDSAFASCQSLTSVTLGGNLTNLGNSAFFECASLTNITIPGGVNYIGDYAFDSCTGLSNVTIGQGVSCTGLASFGNCSALANVSMPNSVTNIGLGSFFECSALTNVTIPPGVTSIDEEAFLGCLSLPIVAIPATVTNFGGGPFANCPKLTAINVDPANPFFESDSGVLYDSDHTMLIQYPGGNPAHKYTIPSTITEIGEGAFEGCGALFSISIPDSVISLGPSVFAECPYLTNIAIGSGVVTIGQSAFEFCPRLTAITVQPNNPAYSTTAGVLFDRCQTTLIAYPPGNPASSYIVPASVTNIEDYAFARCTNLVGIYFQGNAPTADPTAFFYYFGNVTIYYLPGTPGWDAFGAEVYWINLLPWALPYPVVLSGSSSLGVQSNSFGFTVSWATNECVVIESCTNLVDAVWIPLQTNVLVNGSYYFSDPSSTNYAERFYRVRSQ